MNIYIRIQQKYKMLVLTFLTSMMMISCQKGDDSVNPYAEITLLTVMFYNPNTWDLLYNGKPASLSNSSTFKVLAGEAVLSLVNKQTLKTDFEQKFNIVTNDTLVLLQPTPELPVTLIRNNQSREPQPPDGFIKIKMINYTTLAPAGEPVNLEFRQVLGMDWDTFENIYSEKRDTLFNVTSVPAEGHRTLAVEFPDPLVSDFSFEVTFLSKNNEPILKEGKPIKIGFASQYASGGSAPAKIYTDYVSDNDYFDAGNYWTGSTVNIFVN